MGARHPVGVTRRTRPSDLSCSECILQEPGVACAFSAATPAAVLCPPFISCVTEHICVRAAGFCAHAGHQDSLHSSGRMTLAMSKAHRETQARVPGRPSLSPLVTRWRSVQSRGAISF